MGRVSKRFIFFPEPWIKIFLSVIGQRNSEKLEKRVQAASHTFIFQMEAGVWILISIIINEISMEETKKNTGSF